MGILGKGPGSKSFRISRSLRGKNLIRTIFRRDMNQTTGLTEEIKNWFGDGEVDVDLMLQMGAVTEQQILDYWNAKDKLP